MRLSQPNTFCIFGGLLIVAVSGIMWLIPREAPTPGSLIAEVRTLTWSSSTGGPSSGSGPGPAVFVLENVGGTPVRVVRVESGCGCTKPVVRPSVIAPGAKAAVEAHVTPMGVGERLIPITLHTDSPATPEVTLGLRVVGDRRPPYLKFVTGDLQYRDPTESETREVFAETIEPADSASSPAFPSATSPLPFLKIVPVEIAREKLVNEEDPSVLRYYSYRVEFAAPPPEDQFVGEVRFSDP